MRFPHFFDSIQGGDEILFSAPAAPTGITLIVPVTGLCLCGLDVQMNWFDQVMKHLDSSHFCVAGLGKSQRPGFLVWKLWMWFSAHYYTLA